MVSNQSRVNTFIYQKYYYLFSGQYMKQILADVKAFKRGVLTTVANTAKISKLRIGDVKVRF